MVGGVYTLRVQILWLLLSWTMSVWGCLGKELMTAKGQWKKPVNGFWIMVVPLQYHHGGKYGFQLSATAEFSVHLSCYSVVHFLYLLIFTLWWQILGVFEWSGNNPVQPEIWMLPYILPTHPGENKYFNLHMWFLSKNIICFTTFLEEKLNQLKILT